MSGYRIQTLKVADRDGRYDSNWFFWVDPNKTNEVVEVIITSNPPPMAELPPMHCIKINSPNDELVVTLVVEQEMRKMLDKDWSALMGILTNCMEWGYITRNALERVLDVPSKDTPSKSPAKKKAKPSNSLPPACRTALFPAPTVKDDSASTGVEELTDDKQSGEPSDLERQLAAAEEKTAQAVATIKRNALMKKHFSNAVRVSNLPTKLFKEHFMHKLNEQLLSKDMKEAVLCQQVTEPGCALVEFNTVMDASEACLHHLEYESRPLFLHQLTVGDDLLEDRTPQAVEENSPDCSSSVGVLEIPAPRTSRLPKRSVELNSSAGTRRFLKECARCKASEPKFLATRKNLQTIADALTKSNVLGVTIENLQKLNKRLNERYRVSPETSPFCSAMAYVRGEAGANNPFLGESDSDESGIESDDDSNWSDNDVLLLICTVTELKEEYRKVHKNIVFWHKVCKIMKENKAEYTPVECKKKFSFLKATYKKYNRQRKDSGSGHIPWPYFTHLVPLLGDDVSVEPAKTYSAGAKNDCTVNEVLATGSSQPKTPKERRGRARPVTSPEYDANEAKPSKKQEKLDVLKAINAGRADLASKIADLTAVLKDLKK